MADRAIGEDVELEVGASPDVTYTQTLIGAEKPDDGRPRSRRYRIDLANARPTPAIVEVELRIFGDDQLINPSHKLSTKNGRNLWRAVLPANGRESLSYTLDRIRTKQR
jgi:hypothetical protein